MSDPKMTVRYLGFRNMRDGGRKFDFSHALGSETPSLITIDAPSSFFEGPNRIPLQEAAGICYEMLKQLLQRDPQCKGANFNLTSADVAEHRKAPVSSRQKR